MVFDFSCARTVLKNISGNRMWFRFAGPNGGYLDNNATCEFPGDIFTYAASRGKGILASLQKCLELDYVEIVSLPAPIMVDQTTGESVMLGIDDGALTLGDPCWADSVP